jgi:hypothetical protein
MSGLYLYSAIIECVYISSDWWRGQWSRRKIVSTNSTCWCDTGNLSWFQILLFLHSSPFIWGTPSIIFQNTLHFSVRPTKFKVVTVQQLIWKNVYCCLVDWRCLIRLAYTWVVDSALISSNMIDCSAPNILELFEKCLPVLFRLPTSKFVWRNKTYFH